MSYAPTSSSSPDKPRARAGRPGEISDRIPHPTTERKRGNPMTTEPLNPLELYARLNPVSAEQLKELADGPDREATWARILARRDARPRRDLLPRRRLATALVVAVAL